MKCKNSIFSVLSHTRKLKIKIANKTSEEQQLKTGLTYLPMFTSESKIRRETGKEEMRFVQNGGKFGRVARRQH